MAVENEFRTEWGSVPADPDLEADLGYELSELEVIEPGDGDHVLFLPSEEEMVAEEAFVIADPGAVVETLDVR